MKKGAAEGATAGRPRRISVVHCVQEDHRPEERAGKNKKRCLPAAGAGDPSRAVPAPVAIQATGAFAIETRDQGRDFRLTTLSVVN